MEHTRRYIERRIANFEILSLERSTPLLRKQMRHAIALHREALKHSDLDPYLEDLNTLHSQLKEHWTRIYGDLISRAFLLQDIILFQQFLIAKLLEDYTGEPYTIDQWILDQARCVIEQERSVGTNNDSNVDKMYQAHVVYPLEEMMLGRDHVENKLRAAAAKRGRSQSDIQPLIDSCDWLNLARALTNDRDLILKLFAEQPLDHNKAKKILRGIEEIEEKYFSKLSDSSTFTISMHAKEMSAERASTYTNNRSSLTSSTIASSDIGHSGIGPSRNGFAWNIYNAIADGLGGTKPSLKSGASLRSSRTGWDKAASHVDLKKGE